MANWLGPPAMSPWGRGSDSAFLIPLSPSAPGIREQAGSQKEAEHPLTLHCISLGAAVTVGPSLTLKS